MVSTCLNGQSGPQAGLAGYGTMGAALAGFGFLTGWPDRRPASPFLAYTDYTSPKFITAALLAALEHRRKTGEGQWIDCSQAEASAHFLASALLDYTANGHIQRAQGNEHPAFAPSGVYPCRGDDRWIAIAAPDEDAWTRLCSVSGAWADDPRFNSPGARLEHRQALDVALAEWTADHPVDELEWLLQEAGVPAHRASTSTDLFADPQMAFRGHFVYRDHPAMGRVPLESSRMRFSRTPADVRWPGPMYGQHNEEVLRELLGLSDDEIVELVTSGALE
jgi:benzylsuccinate CoA-transferase BbsF subunit